MQAATTARLDAEPASWDPGCSTGNEEQQEASAAVVQPVGVTKLPRGAEQASATRTGGPGDDWVSWEWEILLLSADAHASSIIYDPNQLRYLGRLSWT